MMYLIVGGKFDFGVFLPMVRGSIRAVVAENVFLVAESIVK